VEPRDPEFERKMVEVLHVYKEVEILNEGLVQGTLKEPPVVTISYDENPAFKPWRSQHLIARPSRIDTQATCGIPNTFDWGPFRWWPVSTSILVASLKSFAITTPVPSSLLCQAK
jgi:hypothetical protein